MDETGDSSVLLVGRCLIAGVFLWSGIGRISGYGETGLLLDEHSLVTQLAPIAIAIELAGALLLIVGFKVRMVTLTLASFCVVTALLFHANFIDRAQMFHFLKNFAIVGGLLALYVSGPGRLSFDGLNE
ncbi:MAG TPA: DoxX family protein [Reyranella sp.]|nr:DoxX family protein [Reyranella sp.]